MSLQSRREFYLELARHSLNSAKEKLEDDDEEMCEYWLVIAEEAISKVERADK